MNFTDDNLKSLRLYTLLGVAIYPLLGYYHIAQTPDIIVAIEQRFFLSLLASIYLLASYRSAWIRKHYETIFYIFNGIYLTQYVSFCYINKLPGETLFGYALIQFAITLSYYNTRSLVIHLVYSLALNIPFLFLETHFDSKYLAFATAIVGVLSFALLNERQRLIKSLKKINEKMSLDEKVFYNLLYETSNMYGSDLFRKIAKEVTLSLNLKYCLIGLLNPNQKEINGIGFACNGVDAGSVNYQLAGAPCEHVVNNCPKYYPRNVQQLFPEDKDLVVMEAESYLGVPVFRSNGEGLGIILVLDNKEMIEEKKDLYLRVLKILGQRVAMEVEREEANSQLVDQQVKLVKNAKLASIGELSAGIAHEINNPLAIIRGFAQNSIKSLGHKDEIDIEKLNNNQSRIIRMVERIGIIVKSLKTISRDSDSIEVKPHSLLSIIAESLFFCEERFKAKGIEFKESINIDEVLQINCNYVEISQVLVNIFVNAIHAVEKNEEEKGIELLVERNEMGKVVIKVIDTGHGVPKEIKEKVFDPFFSTKPVGEGTGLGLSLSKSIIAKHRGVLALTEVNGKTCFYIELPVATDSSSVAA